MGKILFKFNEPNWNVVGDTFVVGCKFPESIVFYDTFKENPDFGKYDELGIYKKNCGMDKLLISFGHDEYLYQVLKYNKNHKLSDSSLNMIRYHSLYPWHTNNEYHQFMTKKDYITLEQVKYFNKFDLYSKEDDPNQITEEIIEYYNEILNEYFDGPLQW